MPIFSSDSVELKLLAFLLKAPYHTKSLSLDLNIFAHPLHRQLSNLIKLYVNKYKAPPTQDALSIFANEIVRGEEDLDKFSDALALLEKLPKVEDHEFGFYMERAENYFVGRNIYDLAESIKTGFEKDIEVDFIGMRKNLLKDLLIQGEGGDHIRRGFVYENVKDRLERYRKIHEGEMIEGLVPFGMKELDEKVGGMMKSYLCLIYSRTSGGKSRSMINVAYNNAIAGRNVIYFSLEMAYDMVASCFDSRIGWIDSKKIIYGGLNTEDIKKYKQALKKQLMDKLNIWLVDIPNKATPMKLYEETEIYRAVTGKKPDLAVIDYANLMKPSVPYKGRSEQYDFLFQEFHEFARYTNSALLTASIESRDRSQMDKKGKSKKYDPEDDEVDLDDVAMGVEGIGLSNYIAPHCEMVMRLRQDKYDKLQNRIYFIIEKHRYSEAFVKVALKAIWDKSYVGSSIIPGTENTSREYKIKKEPFERIKEEF